MHQDDPVSLYIVTQPNDKARLRPLVRVMVNMIVRLLADKMDFENGRPVAHYKHRLLMMLDEFPSLGKLEILQESLAFVAGYGIKCYLICQDINQLKSRETGYGHDESITVELPRAERLPAQPRRDGRAPVPADRADHRGQGADHDQRPPHGGDAGPGVAHYQEVQRPLLTPDECLRMPGPKQERQGEIDEAGDMVIYVAGYPAIYGKQPLYFKDPVFQARAAIPAPEGQRQAAHVHVRDGRGGHHDMKPHPETHQRRRAVAGVSVLLLAAGGYAAGARINTTKSIPVGLYWTSSAPVEQGRLRALLPAASRRLR
jgi:type IV secretion system protein VirD4